MTGWLRVCLDRRKWRERKGRDLERGRIPYLDSKMGGKGFGGEGIGRKMWINFVRVVIPPKVERFFPLLEGKHNLPSFLFHSLLDKQELVSFHFSSLPFPSLPCPSLPFFSIQTSYPNIVKEIEFQARS